MITSGIPVLCSKCNGKSFIICSYFCLTTLTLYLGLYLTLRVWHILVVSKRICCSSTSILCTYVNVQLIYKDIKKIQTISLSYIFQVKEMKHVDSLKATDDQSTAPHPFTRMGWRHCDAVGYWKIRWGVQLLGCPSRAPDSTHWTKASIKVNGGFSPVKPLWVFNFQ